MKFLNKSNILTAVLIYLLFGIFWVIFSWVVERNPYQVLRAGGVSNPIALFSFPSSDRLTQDLSVGGEDVPRDARLASYDISHIDEADRFVVLVGNDASDPNRVLIENIGLTPDEINQIVTRDVYISRQKKSLQLRFHPMPLVVRSWKASFLGFDRFVQSYKPECHVQLLFNEAANEVDKDFEKSCERAQ